MVVLTLSHVEKIGIKNKCIDLCVLGDKVYILCRIDYDIVTVNLYVDRKYYGVLYRSVNMHDEYSFMLKTTENNAINLVKFSKQPYHTSIYGIHGRLYKFLDTSRINFTEIYDDYLVLKYKCEIIICDTNTNYTFIYRVGHDEILKFVYRNDIIYSVVLDSEKNEIYLIEFNLKTKKNTILFTMEAPKCSSSNLQMFIIDNIIYIMNYIRDFICYDLNSKRQYFENCNMQNNHLVKVVVNKDNTKLYMIDEDKFIYEYSIMRNTLFKNANIPAYHDMTIITDND